MEKTTDEAVPLRQMSEEIAKGLAKQQKTLPSKYFYDEKGSRLFEEICNLDEYYLTDTELQIMNEYIQDIKTVIGPAATLIELGSGSSLKTRLLLDNLEDLAGYVPVDISGKFLANTAEELRKEYPEVTIRPVVADYTHTFDVPSFGADDRRLIYYPGSTIGNFDPVQAKQFISRIRHLTGKRGGALIGVDLLKEKSIHEAAYNDSQGVTAAFNKNLLERLNRELGTDFDLNSFQHKAIFNEQESRIEMHLISQRRQQVQLNGKSFSLEKHETIHTENSYKYTPEKFAELVSNHYQIKKKWTDPNEFFGVFYLE